MAVPSTLAALTSVLPAPPARIAEVGCGRGALTVALADLGHDAVGIDRDPTMVAATRARGVRAILADFTHVAGEQFDVVLFTRSLHHADDLDQTLRHARSLLAPGGVIVIEEFAWERVDRAAAEFLYAHRARLVGAGLLDAGLPAGEPLLDAWIAGHATLHRGSATLDALDRIGAGRWTAGTSMLWRLVDGRGGSWVAPDARTAGALAAMRDEEDGHIDTGRLPAVGLVAAVRP